MPFATYARSQGRNYFGRRYRGRFVTKNYLKAIVGVPESKWFNVSVTPTAVPNGTPGSYSYHLNPITQGITQNTRVAAEVSNKSLQIRLDIARGAVDSLVRLIIFWYKDGGLSTTGTTLATTILETNDYQSPLNKDNGKSFWVRFDKTYTIAAGQTQLVVDEIWRKLKCKTEYNPETASSPSVNGLYLLALSNQSVIANMPLMSFTSRLTYLDV